MATDILPGIQWLVDEKGLRLPGGLLPGSYTGGILSVFSRDDWNRYDWSSCGGLLSSPDLSASQKPSIATMRTAIDEARKIDTRAAHLDTLRAEAERRITAAYGETTFDDEVKLRLRAGDTQKQNTERDRLRAIYVTKKGALMAMTLPQLQAFDPTTDSHWAAPSS